MKTHIINFINNRFSEIAIESAYGKVNLVMKACTALFILNAIAQVPFASAQVVLFDFDNLPIHSNFPISQTVSGITAHFSGTGQGYSIQDANVLGFTPPGFSGHVIYPNSIYLADLLIKFDQTLTDFSIMYSVQELACDTSATMRVTAYMNGTFVGTSIKVASYPGTWPVDTLSCGFAQGFDSVVVHYDSHPPTCQDYGVVFMADNMRVIPLKTTSVSDPKGDLPEMFSLRQNYPNPFNPGTTLRYDLPSESKVRLIIFNVLGQVVATLVDKNEAAGFRSVEWNGGSVGSGIYFYKLEATSMTDPNKTYTRIMKMLVVK